MKTPSSPIFAGELPVMEVQPRLRFEDTSIAFSHKSTRELRKANLIFSLVNHPFMSAVATGLAHWSFRLGLPVKGLVRSTVFAHFCGGETIDQCDRTIQKLGAFRVGTILDYSVEGENEEVDFDRTCDEIIKTVARAKGDPYVPFCVFKVTGLGDIQLLSRVQVGETLSEADQQAFGRVRTRVRRICQMAYDCQVPVLVDAEDSWIQDVIDQLAYEMMRDFNNQRAIVYNTFQMYRIDMLTRLRHAYHEAAMHHYFLGVKLVRGAYMEKERARAASMGYADPIHPTKEATDALFNQGLAFCIDNKQRISLVCGSHNEYSNLYLTVLMEKHGLQPHDPRVYFSQLLGMSDNISFNLAQAGYNVAKYVPYGPVEAVMPYLLRRAAENTSVAGQSSRELRLIRSELKRRAAQPQ